MAEERPLVCLVDDAQWLDRESASALSFVGRRLAAEGVAMLFAVREPSAEQELEGLPELVLGGLGDADARLLLDAAVPGGLDEEVRERILAEANGNPLALLELPRGLTPAELAGGFGLPDEPELSSRIEQTFLRRVQALPPDTQRALLVAAAEAVGDAAVIAQAAGRLGVGAAGLIAAEDAGLVELGGRVRFRHPLVRSAAYRAATPNERRQAHEALACGDRSGARSGPPSLAPRARGSRPRRGRGRRARALGLARSGPRWRRRLPPRSSIAPPSSARTRRSAAPVPSRRRD